jgi:hypothetical protein
MPSQEVQARSIVSDERLCTSLEALVQPSTLGAASTQEALHLVEDLSFLTQQALNAWDRASGDGPQVLALQAVTTLCRLVTDLGSQEASTSTSSSSAKDRASKPLRLSVGAASLLFPALRKWAEAGHSELALCQPQQFEALQRYAVAALGVLVADGLPQVATYRLAHALETYSARLPLLCWEPSRPPAHHIPTSDC